MLLCGAEAWIIQKKLLNRSIEVLMDYWMWPARRSRLKRKNTNTETRRIMEGQGTIPEVIE